MQNWREEVLDGRYDKLRRVLILRVQFVVGNVVHRFETAHDKPFDNLEEVWGLLDPTCTECAEGAQEPRSHQLIQRGESARGLVPGKTHE